MLYNRKTGPYGSFNTKKRRYQELILSNGKFIDNLSHKIKTKRDVHLIHSKDYKSLRASRKELGTFTALISDEHQGGFHFDVKQFLCHVRPYWVDKAEKANWNAPIHENLNDDRKIVAV